MATNTPTQPSVTIHDKTFTPYLSADRIKQAVQREAAKISADYKGRDPLFVVVLGGAFVFAADLLRELTITGEVAFVRLNSYNGMQSTGQVAEVIGLTQNVRGRDILIVEDIVESGLTMQCLNALLAHKGAASVRVATLLLKPDCLKTPLVLDYCCFNIPNLFVVGYGLDYDGLGRLLPDIYTLPD